MNVSSFQYRIVFVGRDWFIEIQGFPQMDAIETKEVMSFLSELNAWPPARQVFTFAESIQKSAQGELGSIGLNAYQALARARTEQGQWRSDVLTTNWFKGSIT